jgi:hypothetical protein
MNSKSLTKTYETDRDQAIKNFWAIMFSPKYDGKSQDVKKADAVLRLAEDICRKRELNNSIPISVMPHDDQIQYYQDRISICSEDWHKAEENRDSNKKHMAELYCKYYVNKIEFLKNSMKEWKKPDFILAKK